MEFETITLPPKLKALLDLGRVSNLPSVATNVIAAWVLVQGGLGFGLAPVILGAWLLYLAGTTLNDAIDAEFDRENRPERPIPAGVFSVRSVWLIGLSYLIAGCGILIALSGAWIVWVIALATSILVYDFVHKKWQGAVFVMGACRFFLYLVAASAAAEERGGSFWLMLAWAGALFLYIVGLTFVARGESTGGGVPPAAAGFVFVPPATALVALVIYGGNVVSAICWVALVVWIGWCLWRLRKDDPGRTGTFVAGLLAGIPMIDALAVAPLIPWLGVALLLALPVSLLLQRIVAAT